MKAVFWQGYDVVFLDNYEFKRKDKGIANTVKRQNKYTLEDELMTKIDKVKTSGIVRNSVEQRRNAGQVWHGHNQAVLF